MANEFLKAQQIAAAALGLLQREIVLPTLVWRDAVGDFAGAAGDTVSIRIPARTTARTRALRTGGPLVMDELTETKVDVTLDTDIYQGVNVSDEELTLDIGNFSTQVLAPQVRAVAEKCEDTLSTTMSDADYATTITLNGGDPYLGLVDARKALNDANVPKEGRSVVVGSAIEAAMLKSDRLAKVDQSGSDSALRDATVGRMAGFTIIQANGVEEDEGFAFHRTAYVMSLRAPKVPDGATFGQSQSYQGLAMRWIRDYDPLYVRDRSILSTYMGCNTIADGPGLHEVQTITPTGGPTGGTFVLSYKGASTTPLPYNATAAAVKSALEDLPHIGSGNLTVSGSAGGPYTVTFKLTGDVPQLTAVNGLTGGSNPSLAVATTQGGTRQLVRAVKLQLPG